MRFLLATLFLLVTTCSADKSATSTVTCTTTRGPILIVVHPEWSPLGSARFMELVRDKFFDNQILYRALKGFLVQFGIAADPEHQKKWSGKVLNDEQKQPQHAKGKWKRGLLSYAGSGKNSRDCHMFVTLAPDDEEINPYLGGELHEVPFAEVVQGLENIENIEFRHDDGPIQVQGEFQKKGNKFLNEKFPGLDRINSCREVIAPPPPKAKSNPLKPPPIGPDGELLAPPLLVPPLPGSHNAPPMSFGGSPPPTSDMPPPMYNVPPPPRSEL